MWLALSFLSAAFLGLYDVFKKLSLEDNAVLPVLFLNTLFCSLIFLPLILLSWHTTELDGTILKIDSWGGWDVQKYILIKSVLVLLSWILGYFGMKHLPLTIVGPINATRPVITLIGALLVFGERLNGLQWIGVLIAIASYFLLRRGGKKEGIDFHHNVWIWSIIGAALVGAACGLYDKFLMSPDGLGLDNMLVQSWYNIYQCGIMAIILLIVWFPARKRTTPFRWKWSIILISVFLTAADMVYLSALREPGAMISVVSMIRRGSVVVSFLFGAFIFHEKNLRSKVIDLALLLAGLVFLYLGSR